MENVLRRYRDSVEERLWVEIGCGMRVERCCGRRSCGKKRLQVERGVAGGTISSAIGTMEVMCVSGPEIIQSWRRNKRAENTGEIEGNRGKIEVKSR